MITPKQIKEKILSTAPQGYNIDETNAFLSEIAESYSAIYAENKELYRKLEILAGKVEEYREDEDSIKAAVITAQKAADSLKKSAREKAEKLMSESASSAQRTVLSAKEKAEKLISEARNYASSITKEKAEAANEIISEAEQKANTALKSARVLAQDIVDKAQTTSDEIISKANDKKEYYEELTSKLKAEAGTFKQSLVSLYEAQLGKLHDMMEAAEEDLPAADDAEDSGVQNEIDSIFAALSDIDASEYKEDVPAGGADRQAEEETPAEPQEAAPAEDDETPADSAEDFEQAPQEDDAPVEDSAEDAAAGEYVDVDSAVDAFSSDEYTPAAQEIHISAGESEEIEFIDSGEADGAEAPEEIAPPAPPVSQNEEQENSQLPFESFFNVKHTGEQTDEKISLIAPDEDDDEEDLKFRGFFKKKKDKNK